MALGNRLQLRLFLEGIEVPVIAAGVQGAANTPATASIQVIATDRVMDLLPRTLVHLFYYDFVSAGTPVLAPRSSLETSMAQQHYRLMFCGELQAIAITKGHGSRAVVLTCVDCSNYWDTTFQYNFKGSLFAGRRRAAFTGANTTLFNSPLGYGVGTVSSLLSQNSKNFPEMTGLLAGVVRMLEAIGGWYYGSSTFRGCNDFSSIAELRLKLLQQVCAAEADNSSKKLFARKAFNRWMNRQMGSLGTVVSFRTLTKLLFKFIFHECYPCPTPRFIPGTRTAERQKYVMGLEKTKHANFVALAKKAQEAVTASQALLMGGTVLPEYDYATPLAGPGTTQRPTNTDGFYAYARAWDTAVGLINQVVAGSYLVSHASVKKNAGLAGTYAKKIVATQEGAARVISQDHLAKNHGTLINLHTRLLLALSAITGAQAKGSKVVVKETPDRLHTQFFRPDVFFAPPPRCNVLFPEWFSQFQYNRNSFREVSRMELRASNEVLGSSGLFDGRYYAPDVAGVRDGVKLSSSRFARTIMDHELYTGIIPVFHQMTEANIYAMKAGKMTAGQKNLFAQRAVNFMYFKHRFGARAMSAGGHFNPCFIPGLPSLVIDRAMSVDKLAVSGLPLGDQRKALGLSETATQEQILNTLVPPQYLGVCAQFAHSVGQQGGSTSYQFMHARVHKEDTEYLGVDRATVYTRDGTTTKKVVVGVPAGSVPKKGGAGPNGGKILSKPRDVSSQWAGKLIDVLGTQVMAAVGSKVALRLVGKADNYWDQVEIKAYEIEEQVPGYKKTSKDVPIEQVIAPPWIWDGWTNPKVSQTYDQLFGITAITDETSFSAPVMSSEGVQRYYVGEGTQSERKVIDGSVAVVEGSNKSVESSVNALVRAYSFTKLNGMDAGEFLRVYGWRPVATMQDIFGEQDLTVEKVERTREVRVQQRFEVAGPASATNPTKKIYGTRIVTKKEKYAAYVASGKEGFHSRAFSDEADLFGLVNPTVRKVLGLSRDRTKTAAKLDVRARRRAVVRAYVGELTGSKGLLG